MYYLQSRYYDPEIGRFINADSFASTGQGILGNNMYAYCNNNPVMNADPTGHEAISLSLATAAAALIMVGVVAACRLANDLARELSRPEVQAQISNAVTTVKDAVITVASKAVERVTKREHSVYYLTDPEKETVEYVGRTKDVAKRKSAHKNNPNRAHLEMSVVASNLTYLEARSLEQVGMIYHHTINAVNKTNNQINGIAPRYWGSIETIARGTINYADNMMTNEILAWAEG